MSQAESLDLVVIGSGPGGYVAAVRAAQLGLKVAVVERDPVGVGGTCLLRGCIPTKALLHVADVADELKHSRRIGILAADVPLDFPAAMQWKARVVRRLSQGIEGYLFKKHSIKLVKGQGRLAGPGRVVVAGQTGPEVTLDTKAVLVASGSRTRSLPGLPIDGQRVLSSDEILELPALPQSLIVIGAGAVGVEFASLFARLGTQVTLVELLPRVLPLEDEEISTEAAKLLGKQMQIMTGARTEAVASRDQGVEVSILKADGMRTTVSAEKVLVAVGRSPVSDGLGLENTRVRVEKGFIRVKESLETDEPGVYAIGDVIAIEGRAHPQLAHVASHEGIAVAERLAGQLPEPLNYDLVPSATYSMPEVASVGLTEAEARARGYDVRIGRFDFGALAKPRILGQEFGFVKVVSEAKHDEVLGVHLIGPRATDLIAEACVALRLEATTLELMRTVHPHPSLSEAVMQAAEAVYGQAIDA